MKFLSLLVLMLMATLLDTEVYSQTCISNIQSKYPVDHHYLKQVDGENYLVNFTKSDSIHLYYITSELEFEYVAGFYDANSFDLSIDDIGEYQSYIAWLSNGQLKLLDFKRQELRKINDFSNHSKYKPISNRFTDDVLLGLGQFSSSNQYVYLPDSFRFVSLTGNRADDIIPYKEGYLLYNEDKDLLTEISDPSFEPKQFGKVNSETSFAHFRGDMAYIEDNVLTFYDFQKDSTYEITVDIEPDRSTFLSLSPSHISFYTGDQRVGVVDKSDLTTRYFNFPVEPRPYLSMFVIGDKLLLIAGHNFFSLDLVTGKLNLLENRRYSDIFLFSESYAYLPQNGKVYEPIEDKILPFYKETFGGEGYSSVNLDGKILFKVFGKGYTGVDSPFFTLFDSENITKPFTEVPCPNLTKSGIKRRRSLEKLGDKILVLDNSDVYIIDEDIMAQVNYRPVIATDRIEAKSDMFEIALWNEDVTDCIQISPFTIEVKDSIPINLDEGLLDKLHSNFEFLATKDSISYYLVSDIFLPIGNIFKFDHVSRKLTNMGPMTSKIGDRVVLEDKLYVQNLLAEVTVIFDSGLRVDLPVPLNVFHSSLIKIDDRMYLLSTNQVLDLTTPDDVVEGLPAYGLDQIDMIRVLGDSILLLKSEGTYKIIDNQGLVELNILDSVNYTFGNGFVLFENSQENWKYNTAKRVFELPNILDGYISDHIIERSKDTLVVDRMNDGVEVLLLQNGEFVDLITFEKSSTFSIVMSRTVKGKTLISYDDRLIIVDGQGEIEELDVNINVRVQDIESTDSGFYFIGIHPTLGDQVYYLPVSSDPNSTHEPIPLTTSPLTIYPNPASTHITVACSDCPTQPTRFEILTSDGRMVKNGALTSEQTLDLTGLIDGAYHVICFGHTGATQYSSLLIKN